MSRKSYHWEDRIVALDNARKAGHTATEIAAAIGTSSSNFSQMVRSRASRSKSLHTLDPVFQFEYVSTKW